MSIGQNFLVELSHSTVALLMAQRQHDAETIDNIIERHIQQAVASEIQKTTRPNTAHVKTTRRPRCENSGIYEGEVLGMHIRSGTLSSFFAEVVDTIEYVAPEAVAHLARMRARTRAYVARTSTSVHAGRTDLPTRKTSSGWYVSENIGRKDLIRALKALCHAADLDYGRDIRFT
jgi:hypothetical protein